jgi:uncharacterized protein YdbL (DUF1318 family)
MRSLTMRVLMTAALALPAACVTINVYFPEAAAEKAAEQFVGKIIDSDAAPAAPAPETRPPGSSPGAMLLDFLVPSASAQQANIDIQTPQIQAIQSRMRQRFSGSLSRYFASGAAGFTRDGLVAVRDASSVPLAERAGLNQAVADENRDRQAVYREIAVANGHPEWEAQIRATFAKEWIQKARAGWYYQDASGAWKKK